MSTGADGEFMLRACHTLGSIEYCRRCDTVMNALYSLHERGVFFCNCSPRYRAVRMCHTRS